MSIFQLDEGAVQMTEQKLSDAGNAVHGHAEAVRLEIEGLAGRGWGGPAFQTAIRKQQGEFADAAKRLLDEINTLSGNLGVGRTLAVSEDQTSAEALGRVDVAAGNFGRLNPSTQAV